MKGMACVLLKVNSIEGPSQAVAFPAHLQERRLPGGVRAIVLDCHPSCHTAGGQRDAVLIQSTVQPRTLHLL